MQEVENLLEILEKTKEAIQKEDTATIRNLSDRTNNTVAKTHDPDNITLAVIIYAMSKIIERKQYRNYSGWNRFYKNVNVYFDKLINCLKRKDEECFSETLKLIRAEIDNLSGKLRRYIQDVFRKAEINKASKIYEHGISLEKTAKLLGLTMFEVANYSGQTEIGEENLSKVNVKTRIKNAMGIFG